MASRDAEIFPYWIYMSTVFTYIYNVLKVWRCGTWKLEYIYKWGKILYVCIYIRIPIYNECVHDETILRQARASWNHSKGVVQFYHSGWLTLSSLLSFYQQIKINIKKKYIKVKILFIHFFFFILSRRWCHLLWFLFFQFHKLISII